MEEIEQRMEERRRTGEVSTAVKDDFDYLGVNHFYNLLEKHFDLLFPGSADANRESRSREKQAILGWRERAEFLARGIQIKHLRRGLKSKGADQSCKTDLPFSLIQSDGARGSLEVHQDRRIGRLIMTRRGKLLSFLNMGCILLLVAVTGGAEIVSDSPEARSPITLLAVTDRNSGRDAFAFDGHKTAPVIRAMPGESIRITYRNTMSPTSTEKCATGPCMNMTNLHFHGLHVSPNAPQDDVLTMVAMPGQSLEYTVDIPRDEPPGLYWYHTHPHGESYRQALDGMSGAIVIEGFERYVPEIRQMRERILVLRDRTSEKNDPAFELLKQTVEMPANRCSITI
jgi:Multicopper oxidase